MWDTLIIILILYTSFVMPYMSSFDIQDDSIALFDVAIDCLFILDIFLNFFTTYIDSRGDVVTIPKKIRIHYLRGWFVIDMLSSLPYLIYYIVSKIAEVSKKINY